MREVVAMRYSTKKTSLKITQNSQKKRDSKIFFRKNEQRVVLLEIYLLNYDSSGVNFLHVEYGVWLCLEYGFCQGNWNLLQYITKITKTFFFSQPVFWYVVLFDEKLIVLHHGDYFPILFWHLYQTHTSDNLNDGKISLDVWTTL